MAVFSAQSKEDKETLVLCAIVVITTAVHTMAFLVNSMQLMHLTYCLTMVNDGNEFWKEPVAKWLLTVIKMCRLRKP